FRGRRLWDDDRAIAGARLVGSQSGSGLPHSKTLRESEGATHLVPAFGLRQPSAAFPSLVENFDLKVTFEPVLNSARRRRPNELVHLQLKARCQIIGQHPLHNLTWLDPAKNWRK